MFVRAVAGVDDGDVEMAGDEIGGAGGRVAHDEAIGLHGVERLDGVEERFTFFQAGGFGLEVHGVGAEARGGSAEADACARGVFEERESDGFAAKGGEFFERIALDGLKVPALIEKKSEFVRGERFKRQEIAETEGHICTLRMDGEESLFNYGSCRSTRTTRSSLSISRRRTSMISVSLVCTVRPTNCASMGISRWPRSMSTQSETR